MKSLLTLSSLSTFIRWLRMCICSGCWKTMNCCKSVEGVFPPYILLSKNVRILYGFFWLKELRPLQIAPMSNDAGIPLTDQGLICCANNFLHCCYNFCTTDDFGCFIWPMVCQHSRTCMSLSTHMSVVEPFKYLVLLLRESTPWKGHHASQKCLSPCGLHCPGLAVLRVLEGVRLSLLGSEPLTVTSDRSFVRDH